MKATNTRTKSFGLSRREFGLRAGLLSAAALTPALSHVRAGLARMGEGAENPGPREIIDTHTHFYDPTRAKGVPWPDKNDSFLYRKVLPENFNSRAKPLGVTGTVVVEASAWFEDNQWILDLAANEKVIVGFVGHLSPEGPDFKTQLESLAKNPLFRGIRIGGGVLQKNLDAKTFQSSMSLMSNRGLSLDVLGDTNHLTFVAKLAAQFPQLKIIINHVANVRIDGKAPPAGWTDGMRLNKDHTHVYCKVSGLVEGTGAKDVKAPKEIEFYRPVLDRVWDVFGPERLIYGSNWPVSERFASYETVQEIALGYFRSKGQDALDRVFWKNASAAYQWTRRV